MMTAAIRTEIHVLRLLMMLTVRLEPDATDLDDPAPQPVREIYFNRRRASSDVSGSLSLSASGIAARSSASAAALLPDFRASLPSSRWLRAWTHFRPSRDSDFLRSASASARPSAASAVPRLYRHNASSPNIRGRWSSAN